MEEILKQIAEETGVPVDLLQRAAAARAQASGASTEAILAEWSGGEIPVAAEPAAAPVEADPAPAPAPAPAVTAPVAEGPSVEVLGAAEPVVDDEADEDAESDKPVADDEPASVLSGFPRWLAASFVLIPTIAVLYALLTPNAPDCGAAGQLAIDPVTGNAVNCDGTPYGLEIVNFFSIGGDIYATRCASCHGNTGEGGGQFPPLAGGSVTLSFPSCGEHLDWVSLGSEEWPDRTYGALNKPVGGSGALMPAFGPVLSDEDLAAVVLFERVSFGGEALADSEEDCGLAAGDEVVAAP